MRIRVVLCGAVAGIFCILALWFPWYVVFPASIAPDWPYLKYLTAFPAWLNIGVAVFCGLTLFTFGWIAARWNWARNRRDSFLAGAGAGLIAGCLIYDFIGAFHFGLLGQQDILKAFSRELTQTEGLTLMVDAISKSAYYLYSYFLIVIVICIALSALGGFVSAFDAEDLWGTSPRNPEGWLFRLTAYSLSINGAFCTMAAIATFVLLQESVVNAAIKNNLTGVKTLPVFISLITYMTGLMMTLFPLSITWGWMIRAWKNAGLWRVLYAAWGITTILITAVVFVNLIRNGSIFFYFPINNISLPYDWIFTFGVIIVGLTVGLLSTAVAVPDSKYLFSDWLGYLFAQGILGGTQIFISVPAYAFTLVMLTIVNIPHLMQSGTVAQTPAQQLEAFSKLMTSTVEWSMVACLFGGLLFAGIVALIRRFLKIAPVLL